MANPLLGGSGNPNQGSAYGPFGNAMNFINRFNQFRQNFTGNPQQAVQNLLNSGQMSQEQYQQLSSMAQQIMPMFKK